MHLLGDFHIYKAQFSTESNMIRKCQLFISFVFLFEKKKKEIFKIIFSRSVDGFLSAVCSAILWLQKIELVF